MFQQPQHTCTQPVITQPDEYVGDLSAQDLKCDNRWYLIPGKSLTWATMVQPKGHDITCSYDNWSLIGYHDPNSITDFVLLVPLCLCQVLAIWLTVCLNLVFDLPHSFIQTGFVNTVHSGLDLQLILCVMLNSSLLSNALPLNLMD